MRLHDKKIDSCLFLRNGPDCKNFSCANHDNFMQKIAKLYVWT